MTRRDLYTHTEADAGRFDRDHNGYDPRDDQPSPSDLRADIEADLLKERQRGGAA